LNGGVTPKRAVIALAIFYFFVLGFFCVRSHRGLLTQMNDLGNANQAIWQASRGNFSMPVSNASPPLRISRLAIHANFIFWFIAPAYLLWPSPEMLLWLTTLACAFAGLGLFALAVRRFPSWWALLAPAVFWASPLVQDANLYDFHAVTLFCAFFIWMVWAFEEKRTWLGWTLFVLALLCEEQGALMLLFYGGVRAMTEKDKKQSAIMTLLTLGYLLLVTFVLMPYMRSGGPVMGSEWRYEWLAAATPEQLLTHMFRLDRVRVILYLFVCGAAFGVRSWKMLLVLAPPVIAGLFSSSVWATRLTGTYYWMSAEMVIVLAVLFTEQKKSLVRLAMVTAVLSILFSPLPYGLWAGWDNFPRAQHRDTLDMLEKSIPAEASLVVQNNVGAHFSNRENVWSDGPDAPPADFALFHVAYDAGRNTGLKAQTLPEVLYQFAPVEFLERVHTYISSSDWALVEQRDGYYLFQKRAKNRAESANSEERFRADAHDFSKAVVAANNKAFVLFGYFNGEFDL
jgi:uncharacterized membrane protein